MWACVRVCGASFVWCVVWGGERGTRECLGNAQAAEHATVGRHSPSWVSEKVPVQPRKRLLPKPPSKRQIFINCAARSPPTPHTHPPTSHHHHHHHHHPTHRRAVGRVPHSRGGAGSELVAAAHAA